jgi:membrane protein implicated in regulation of membrane protease activity
MGSLLIAVGERRYSRRDRAWSSRRDDRTWSRAPHDGGVVLLVAILVVVFATIPTPWNAVVILAACVLEVVEVVILRRWSKRLNKRTKQTTGAEALIGEPAKVIEPCHPDGMVQLRGELWAARCEEGADTGDTVTVKSLEGLKLVVAR